MRAVIAKSFARLHAANLTTAGILPLTFRDPTDYDTLDQGDELALSGLFAALESGEATLLDKTKGVSVTLDCRFTERQRAILLAGGLVDYTRNNGDKKQ